MQKPPAIAAPKGGAAIRGIGEKFAANPATGTGAMSVPLGVTPGRAGFGPQLQLNYDSGSGNGAFGFGWSLTLPAITRKTDKGLPRYDDAIDSDVFLLTGAEDLQPVLIKSGDDWIRPTPATIVKDGATYRVERYRPRTEGLFARIERWTDAANGDTHWRSISRENVTTVYGRTGLSRVADPDDASRVFSWLMCESYDDRGNAIEYEYQREDSVGVDTSPSHERNRSVTSRSSALYLKYIRYGNRASRLTSPGASPDWMFVVAFDYDQGHYTPIAPNAAVPLDAQHEYVRAAEEGSTPWRIRPDVFSSYRSGFELRWYRRCRRILMFHRFAELGGEPCLVRSTDFEYDDLDYAGDPDPDAEIAHTGSTRFASFIRTMVQSNYVRDDTHLSVVIGGVTHQAYLRKTMPPVEFEYSKARIVDAAGELDAASLENLPAGIDGAEHRWVDLDGEGMPGVLVEEAAAWFYKPNLGGGRFGDLQAVARLPAAVAGSTGAPMQLVDLSGDGQLDLVAFGGVAPGFYERTPDEAWDRFRPFVRVPNVDWTDTNMRLVDLDGDGHADILITQDDVVTWYPSLAEEGFEAPRRIPWLENEEKAPRLVFADRSDSVYLADMSGDGVSDLVRIRNGEVCYWPNLGYGRFGAKVTMDNSPWLDLQDQFDQRRVRLADIDGSGVNDLIYLGRDGARIYFNRCGNAWTTARPLPQFPRVDDVTSAATADLFGNGTACLVWSSPAPAAARRPLQYIDLMGGVKPHLLIKVRNNLGAETRVHYVASTHFYAADKLAGRRWITRLPFPVHVVARLETYDFVARNRFVSRRAYHHGFFDGDEREFRGFAMVEQWDTEEFGSLAASGDFPDGDNVDEASAVPPLYTKSWFHTGVYIGRGRISNFFAGLLDGSDAGEYFRAAGLADPDARVLLLDDTVLPAGLSVAEEREACRALRGVLLRQEIYAQDRSALEPYPYSVMEQNFAVETVQRRGANPYAVFFTHQRESLTYHYERNPADPRVMHSLTLKVDEWGNVLTEAAIGYRRQTADAGLAPQDQAQQAAVLITYTENVVSNAVDVVDAYRTPLHCETRTYEITGATLPLGSGRFSFSDVETIGSGAAPLAFDQPPVAGMLQKRLIEHVRTRYRRDDLTGPLPPAVVEPLALIFETYTLALTPGLIGIVHGPWVTGAMLAEAGYVHSEGDAQWWVPSGRVRLSPGSGDTPAMELAHARQHFFLPRRFRDPFNTEVLVNYDAHDLLPIETIDPLDNRVTVGERDAAGTIVVAGYDYRVMQPRVVTDPNGNRTAVAFDARGLVVGTAVMGKRPPAAPEGDDLTGFVADLTDAVTTDHLTNPLASPALVLGQASTRLIYDVFAYYRTRGLAQPQPVCAYALARESHHHDPAPPGGLRIQHNFSYSDGFGREIQKKTQAEPGPVPVRDPSGAIVLSADGSPVMSAADVSPRWVGSGWTILNNKGKPVRQYEPFFTDRHAFEFDVRVGVSPVLFYDPADRVVATLHPNHSWEKVVFGAWRQETWDVNDTVLIADPKSDPQVGDFSRRLPAGAYLPTWYSARQGGAMGAAEQSAALQTAVHAATPTVVHSDTLGRTFLAVASNRAKYSNAPAVVDTTHESRTRIDIDGNQREVSDAKGRVVARYDYDMGSNVIHYATIDGGDRWMLSDINGKPLYSRDSRNHLRRTSYDVLRRPTALHLRTGGGAEQVVARTVYGEGQPGAAAANLRGTVAQSFDQSGILTTERYDFKGNALRTRRRVAADYKGVLDWAGVVALRPETYTAAARFDAVNRLVQMIAPHLEAPGTSVNVIQPGYNEANLLEKTDVWLNQSAEPAGVLPAASADLHAVTDIDYDAHGERTGIRYGNGVLTTYVRDRLTHRLRRLLTARDPALFVDDCPQPPLPVWPGCHVQDLQYTYDPIGNVVSMRDDAQQRLFFHNRRVDPSAAYTFDALYRLIEASGREHLGQAGAAPVASSYNDWPRIGIALSASDGNAVARYLERYRYDQVGNFLEVQHVGTSPSHPGWTRSFTYDEASWLQPALKGNRLTRTVVGPVTEPYSVGGSGYDAHGNMLRMPHLQEMQWDFRDQLRMTRRQAIDAGDIDGTAHQGERTWYVYGADGARVRKVTETAAGAIKEDRLYLGGFEIYERHGAGALVRETLHIMDDKQRIALIDTRTDVTTPVARIRFQHANHLGSASLELDDEAAIISYEEYTPYGSTSFAAVESQTEAAKRYRYAGKERDEETGLSYFGARYFAPWIGRWTAVDPEFEPGTTQSPYIYTSANPVSRVDPDGRDDAPTASSAKPLPSRWRTTVPPPPGSPPGAPEVSIYNEELMARLRKAQRAGQLAGADYGESLAYAKEALSNKGFFRFEELKKRGPKGAEAAEKLANAVRADIDRSLAKFPKFADPMEQESAVAAFKWSSGQAFEQAQLELGARRIAFDILMFAGAAALERASLLLVQAAARKLVGPMLRAATIEAATAAMQAGKPVGPVVAGVTDLRTGQSFFALNAKGLPSNLHPILKARIEALEGAPQHFSLAGSHAEVHALNDALWARTNAGMKVTEKSLGEFMLDTAWLRGSKSGRMTPLQPAPRCGNCSPITDGVINMAGDAPPQPPVKK